MSTQTHPNRADASDSAPVPQDAPEVGAAAADASLPEHLLESVVEPVVETMGLELVHLSWTQSGRHRKLQVFLDRPGSEPDDGKGGVTLDDCSRMSPIISNALDAAEADPASSAALRRLLEGAYTLEVSSPGLDRPLGKRSHFERFQGRRVTVRTAEPIAEGSKQKNFHGWIEGVEQDPIAPDDDRRGVVVLRADDGEHHQIALVQIRRANLVFEG
jgi:ribosome maturation factor RimP